MVSDSDAIVDPGTVMIISLNTPPAYDAVPAPASPNDLALRAETLRIEGFQETEELDALVGNVSWILAAQYHVQEQGKGIED